MKPSPSFTVLTSFAAACITSLALAACGSSQSSPGRDDSSNRQLAVSAAFYPLAHAVEEVGATSVSVTNLTKPGVEAHDLELTPQDVLALTQADLVVYHKGFQPAVDRAVAELEPSKVLDVATFVDLTLPLPDDGHDHGSDAHHDHPEAEIADPHFWLDPTIYAKAVAALAGTLGKLDPDNAAAYDKNARAFAAELAQLDLTYQNKLQDCSSRELVTSHAAFAYLAARYNLTQRGIAGTSPDVEPTAAAIKKLIDYVRQHEVTTIYSETLASPAFAETLARETGATVSVLDPLEGLTDRSSGRDYIEVMRANLAVLREGQGCR